MLTKTTLKVFALVSVLSVVGAACVVSGLAREETDPTLRDIARYREWKRLNEKPLFVINPSAGG